MGKLKTRTFVWFFLCLAAVCLIWLLFPQKSDAHTVRVLVNGELYTEIDLSGVVEPYTLAIGAHNTLEVTPDGVRMLTADCPDGSCLRQGYASPGKPVICLPNRVVVEAVWTAPSDLDAVVG